MSSNPVIQLAANSFYIATDQIMAEAGKFHWFILITDDVEAATKYHWAPLPAGGEKAEGVVITNVQPVKMYSDTGVVTFGFFRIAQIAPPSARYIRNIAEHAFESPHTLGYATIRENRKRNLTCRTWAMTVYAKLQAAGIITRNETREDIEAIITAKSIDLEEKAARGELETSKLVNI